MPSSSRQYNLKLIGVVIILIAISIGVYFISSSTPAQYTDNDDETPFDHLCDKTWSTGFTEMGGIGGSAGTKYVFGCDASYEYLLEDGDVLFSHEGTWTIEPSDDLFLVTMSYEARKWSDPDGGAYTDEVLLRLHDGTFIESVSGDELQYSATFYLE